MGRRGQGKATDELVTSTTRLLRPHPAATTRVTHVVNGEKFALHLLPTGILTPGCTSVIANGVVVSPEALFREVDGLEARGVDTSTLVVSANAHVIASYHSTIDKVAERFLGKNKIGTTGRGIGPAYADKMNRTGIRIADLFDESILRQKVEGALDVKNHLLAKVYNRRAISGTRSSRTCCRTPTAFARWSRTPAPCSTRRWTRARPCSSRGPRNPLDVDHGTYPFVTSSNAIAGGVCTGAGVGPTRIDRVIGVIKAYTTRVGSGPFPTELFDADGDDLQRIGGEVGVSTGRTRRCGWFDAVIARYSSRVNGLTDYYLTKLDILSHWEQIPVCVAYDIDGTRHEELPMTQSEFHHATPVYEMFEGWKTDISGCRSFEDLPKNARVYVEALEEMSGTPFWGLGVGPGREQTVLVRG